MSDDTKSVYVFIHRPESADAVASDAIMNQIIRFLLAFFALATLALNTQASKPEEIAVVASSPPFGVDKRESQGAGVQTGCDNGPAFHSMPGELDFGDVPIGVSATEQFVEVENVDTWALEVDDVRFDGRDQGAYELTFDDCSGASLPPGSTCVLGVVFTPDRAGVFQAQLRLRTTLLNIPGVVPVVGSSDVISFSGFESGDSTAGTRGTLWRPVEEPGSGGRIDSLSVKPGDSDRILVGGDLFGAGYSADGGANWSGDYAGLAGYEIGAFTWHPTEPDTVWMGSLSGPHKSTNGGCTWTAKRNGMPALQFAGYSAPIERILFDPQDPSRLVAFGGDHRNLKGSSLDHYGHVWRSTDGGESWSRETTVVAEGNIQAATYGGDDGETIWAAIYGHGVYRSSNDGEAGTWSRRSGGLPSDPRTTGIAAHPTDEDTAWVLTAEHGVYFTDDGGTSWSARNNGITLGPRDVRYKSLKLAGVVDGEAVLYASNAPQGGSGMGIYKTTDGGDSWTHVYADPDEQLTNGTPFPSGPGAWWIEIDPNDPDTVWAGGSARIISTSDAGTSWVDRGVQAKGGDRFAGRGFTGWIIRDFAWNPWDYDHLVSMAMDSGKFMVSFDAGASWRLQNKSEGLISNFGGGQAVAFHDEQLLYAGFGQSDYKSIARSRDQGRSFEVLARPAGASGPPYDLHVDRQDPDRLWAIVGDGLYYSDDADAADGGTVTWQPIALPGGAVALDLERDPFDADAYYVATDAGIYRSPGDNTFEPLDGPVDTSPGGMGIQLAADPSNAGRLYAAFHSTFADAVEGVWRYDGHWQRLFQDNWTVDVAVDPNNADRLILATNKNPFGGQIGATGVWVSADGGANWRQRNDGLPMLRVGGIDVRPDGAEVAVYSRGVYTTTMDELFASQDSP